MLTNKRIAEIRSLTKVGHYYRIPREDVDALLDEVEAERQVVEKWRGHLLSCSAAGGMCISCLGYRKELLGAAHATNTQGMACVAHVVGCARALVTAMPYTMGKPGHGEHERLREAVRELDEWQCDPGGNEGTGNSRSGVDPCEAEAQAVDAPVPPFSPSREAMEAARALRTRRGMVAAGDAHIITFDELAALLESWGRREREARDEERSRMQQEHDRECRAAYEEGERAGFDAGYHEGINERREQ